jgi:chromosome segregation ATPase
MLEAELEALANPPPTAADSAAVTRTCGDPTGPSIYRQVQGLYDQKERYKTQMQQAELDVSRLEQEASGMNDKQLAMACERIKEYLKRLKAKLAQGGFSEKELAALQQRIKDLEELCD